MGERMRLLTLLARHGVANYPNALPDWRKLVRRQLPDATHDVAVIDNALPPDHRQREDGLELIGSTNRAWEFSAWDSGISYVGSRLEQYDFVALVTSAFQQLDPVHLGFLDDGLVHALRGRFAATGHIDYYDAPVRLLGTELQSWIRSSVILLPPTVLLHLGSLVSIADGSAFFSGDPDAPFRAEAPISANYREYILGWLTGEGTGQGTQWHSRFALSSATLPLFEKKTLAILNEQMLTHRLRAAGCATIDLTWFGRQCRGGGAPQTIPEWRVQLAGRS